MLTQTDAINMQEELSQCVVQYDDLPHPVRVIAGADVEYDKDSNSNAGTMVLLDADTKEMLEVATHVMTATFPYIPSLFSFREMLPLVKAYRKLHRKPGAIVCDGHRLGEPHFLFFRHDIRRPDFVLCM